MSAHTKAIEVLTQGGAAGTDGLFSLKGSLAAFFLPLDINSVMAAVSLMEQGRAHTHKNVLTLVALEAIGADYLCSLAEDSHR